MAASNDHLIVFLEIKHGYVIRAIFTNAETKPRCPTTAAGRRFICQNLIFIARHFSTH